MASASDRGDLLIYVGALALGIIAYNTWRNSRAALADAGSAQDGQIGAGEQTLAPTAAAGTGTSNALLDALLPMQVSPAGQAFIKREEGWTSTVKNDVGHPEIGWGHDIQPGENITGPINQAQGQQILEGDLAETAAVLQSALQMPVTQNQFDALASLEFNIGASAFRASTVLRQLNAGNYAAASQAFAMWVKSAGQTNSVLVGRRGREQQLFNS